MTFIIHYKDGSRETYSNRYDEDDEMEVERPIVIGMMKMMSMREMLHGMMFI